MQSEMQMLLEEHIPSLTKEQHEKLATYYDMLVDWNTRLNLTAITEMEDVVKKHFLDSLLALEHIKENATVIDVGTGAGFPGMVIAVARPDIRMTLLDSLNKRVKFLEAVKDELSLDVKCVHSRAEDAARNKEHRERYDYTVSRAIAPLPVLLELTVPFVKTGGCAIAYKGPTVSEEIENSKRAAQVLACEVSIVTHEMDYGTRSLAIAKKNKPTKMIYPRKAGEPSRNPL